MPARFENEEFINSMSPRERRRLSNPFANYVWRNGRILPRQSPAERATRRKSGQLEDQVFDVWTAFHLGDETAIEWFLGDYLRLKPKAGCRSSENLREALYHVIGTEWADKPAQEVDNNPPPWYDPTAANQMGYLYEAVRKEAERRFHGLQIADKPWGTRGKRAERSGKVLPTQCALNPAVQELGDEGRDDPSTVIGLSNPELLEDLAKWQRQELDRALVKQAKGVLPERQYQVFRLSAEGHNYKEIANQLGISISAAKSNMWNARQNDDLRKMGRQWA
jgi:DNA-directed RNA polymerase specialized sigma24 family protein